MVAKKIQIEDTTTTHGPKRVKTLLVEDLYFMTAFALEGYLLFDVAVLCMDLLFETFFYLIGSYVFPNFMLTRIAQKWCTISGC